MGLIIEPKKTALILGGGGYVGIFQLGALKIIEENKIPIDEVIGVSVGSLNGAAFLMRDFSTKELSYIWHRVIQKPSTVFQYQSALYFMWKLGVPESIYRQEPLRRLVARIDSQKLIEHPKEFIAATTHMPSGKITYFSSKDPKIIAEPVKMNLAIMASCSIQPAFPGVLIEHKGEIGTYIDGAYKRPLPIKKAVEDGCDTVIVVRCHANTLIKPLPPRWDGALNESIGLFVNGREKDEINYAHERIKEGKWNVNLFVIEPDDLPETLDTNSFKKTEYHNDFVIGENEGKRAAASVLQPLIEHYRNQKIAPQPNP